MTGAADENAPGALALRAVPAGPRPTEAPLTVVPDWR